MSDDQFPLFPTTNPTPIGPVWRRVVADEYRYQDVDCGECPGCTEDKDDPRKAGCWEPVRISLGSGVAADYENAPYDTDVTTCEPDEIDLEEGLTAVALAVKHLRENLYIYGQSAESGGYWLVSDTTTTFTYDGSSYKEVTHAFLKGFTEAEENEIHRLVALEHAEYTALQHA